MHKTGEQQNGDCLFRNLWFVNKMMDNGNSMHAEQEHKYTTSESQCLGKCLPFSITS